MTLFFLIFSRSDWKREKRKSCVCSIVSPLVSSNTRRERVLAKGSEREGRGGGVAPYRVGVCVSMSEWGRSNWQRGIGRYRTSNTSSGGVEKDERGARRWRSLPTSLLFCFPIFFCVCRPLPPISSRLFCRKKRVVDGWGGGWWREKRIDASKTQARTIRVFCVLVCAPRYRLRWPMAERQWRRPLVSTLLSSHASSSSPFVFLFPPPPPPHFLWLFAWVPVTVVLLSLHNRGASSFFIFSFDVRTLPLRVCVCVCRTAFLVKLKPPPPTSSSAPSHVTVYSFIIIIYSI
jgi:hypothetical protein